MQSARDSGSKKTLKHSTRERVVLFGGASGGDRLADTWVLAEADSWSRVTPEGESPAGRWFHELAYDAAGEHTVLFGGANDEGEALADTWAFDGTAWIEPTPDSGSPLPRTKHAMVYDAARGQIVLFGGYTDDREALGDTWIGSIVIDEG